MTSRWPLSKHHRVLLISPLLSSSHVRYVFEPSAYPKNKQRYDLASQYVLLLLSRCTYPVDPNNLMCLSGCRVPVRTWIGILSQRAVFRIRLTT
ncbi:hypothetical protein Plhal304r1_c049g0131781 [Plasmopara halstedii]